jgi:hypothetical protein
MNQQTARPLITPFGLKGYEKLRLWFIFFTV